MSVCRACRARGMSAPYGSCPHYVALTGTQLSLFPPTVAPVGPIQYKPIQEDR